MSTRNRIALLQARSSKVAKLKIQVFRLKIGKELSNMREIEKSLKTKNGKTVIRIVGDLVKMCTDGIYLTKKTEKVGKHFSGSVYEDLHPKPTKDKILQKRSQT